MHNGSEVDEFDSAFNMYRTGKLSMAALDQYRNLICAPWGGMAPLIVNVDTMASRWLTKANSFTGAVSAISYIHASDTGRVYLFLAHAAGRPI